MAVLANTAHINRLRKFQESLMTDSCVVSRNGSNVAWPRNNSTTIPCRVGYVHTFPAAADPQDARAKDLSVMAVTMPHDFPVIVSDVLTWSGDTLIVGETNRPQTWLIASRAYVTKQKTAVSTVPITFYRRDFDTGNNAVVATYNVKIIFNKEEAVEVPSRYSLVAGASFKSITIIFPDGINPIVTKDDTFEYEGRFGFIQSIVPNQPLRVEAYAWVDFGSSR